MALGQKMREFVGGDPERDDERQVEEELERGRRPVRLVRVPSAMRVRECGWAWDIAGV
jgi:hypothetical protein